ncbi:MAG: hypothetical protein PVJ57_04170 [Phycisphaerae bacterium]|jgi:hypothetical protein
MIDRQRPCAAAAIALLAAGLLLSVGCHRPACVLELRSYQDPYFPETYRLPLDRCVCRDDVSGNRDIIGTATHPTADPKQPPITQYLHVHLFWQPKPGVTFSNETSVNATIRYLVVTPTGSALYVGTGFVYPKRRRWGRLIAEVETARLHLEEQVGMPPEVLGDTRLSGTLVAREDSAATVDLMHELDLHLAEP